MWAWIPKIITIVGWLKMAWAFIRPLLTSAVAQFLADPDVQALAVQAVERATRVDLDGDGKHDHAVADMIAELRRIGKSYYRAWVAIAVEAAFQRLPKPE